MKNLDELSERSNYSVFWQYDKPIVLYEDHRCILNVLYIAKKNDFFKSIPDVIYFDKHDDALKPEPSQLKIFKKSRKNQINLQKFWEIVEFDLSPSDADWLKSGMELGLINNSVLIGSQYNETDVVPFDKYIDHMKEVHEMYTIPHLSSSLAPQGCLGDSVLKEPYYQKVRNIIECNQESRINKNDFVLDFDLDCFSINVFNATMAWPEDVFVKEFVKNDKVHKYMRHLIENSSIITICKESQCCGGLGESNKILYYLDKYFFEFTLKTIPCS